MRALDDAVSIEDLRSIARRRLPPRVFDFIDGGADDEVALRRNRSEFDRATLHGRPLHDTSVMDTSARLWTETAPSPLIVAPMGACGFAWPDADVEIARAATQAALPYVLSTFSNTRIEDLARLVQGRLWYQLYPLRDRSLTHGLVFRALAADYQALVVTLDVAAPGNRERDRRHAATSVGVRLRNLAGFATRPIWCAGVAARGLPRFVNLGNSTSATGGTLATNAGLQVSDAVTWEELERLRERWPRKFIVKGIQHPSDAQRLTAMGVDAVWMSNHGGRQLDAAPGTLSLLCGLGAQERGRALVIADSGFRRGSDVLKALMHGADAVALGRAVLYGAAAGGGAGAAKALNIIQAELVRTMRLCGMSALPPKHTAPLPTSFP